MYYLDIGLCTTLTTLTMYYPHYLGNVLPGHWTMYYLERRASCKERLIAVELILCQCLKISDVSFEISLGLES